jgi:DNA-nicking Smr family endonuclease
LQPLSHGAAPGVDRRTAERLRRGQIEPEAEIDLHGHRIADARRALAAFLEAASNQGLRSVLVITGKGLRSGLEEGVMPRELLRDQVPAWLNEPANRARVLAFTYAQPRHGGRGALYVLLRKKR